MSGPKSESVLYKTSPVIHGTRACFVDRVLALGVKVHAGIWFPLPPVNEKRILHLEPFPAEAVK